MDDLEVFKLSALACGKNRVRISSALECIYDEPYFVWNPFTNAEQRWQCVEKLLEMGDMKLLMHGDAGRFLAPDAKQSLALDCPASEFPARALSALWEKK